MFCKDKRSKKGNRPKEKTGTCETWNTVIVASRMLERLLIRPLEENIKLIVEVGQTCRDRIEI